MLLRLATAAVLGLATVSATGGEAEICYSAPVPFAQAVSPTNSTVFICPVAGSKTLPQLAAEGWEIVQLSPLVVNGSSQTDQLVIQRKR